MRSAYASRQMAMCTRPSSSQSSGASGRRAQSPSLILLTAERILEPLELAVELARPAGTDVGLEHEPDTRRGLRQHVAALLDDSHALVPLPFDRREHRVGAVRQTGVAHDANGSGDGVRHGSGVVGRDGGGDGEGDQHGLTVCRPRRRHASTPPRRSVWNAFFIVSASSMMAKPRSLLIWTIHGFCSSFIVWTECRSGARRHSSLRFATLTAMPSRWPRCSGSTRVPHWKTTCGSPEGMERSVYAATTPDSR